MANCIHVFHKTCMKSWIKKNGKTANKLSCPVEGCNKIMDDDNLLDLDFLQIYKPPFSYCPNLNCNVLFLRNNAEEFDCFKCKFNACLTCRIAPYH